MTKNKSNSVPKLPAHLAAATLYSIGIRTSTDFADLCHGRFNGLERPANVPSNPIDFYPNVSSFFEFLMPGVELVERGKFAAEKVRVMSYLELKRLVRAHEITTVRQWKEALKSKSLPGIFPASPDRFYAGEFEGWPVFMAPKKSRFLPFNEARELARKLQAESTNKPLSSFDWRWMSRNGRLPKGVPSAPIEFYSSDWVSWHNWYGTSE